LLNGTRLRLTDGAVDEARSAFFSTLVNVQSFTTSFSFQITPASTTTADGFTFTIQGNGATALGPAGGGLGYGPKTPTGAPGIPKSMAVKFDLYNNAGEGVDSTGIYTNGTSPTIPARDLTSSGVNLHSGHVLTVQMTYSGTSLAMTITDTTTAKSFSTTFTNVDIPSIVGGNTAFAGFTGGTGGVTATQEIISWTYSTSTASKTPIQYETESSTVFNASKSSGPTYRVFAWSGFTDGQGTILDATAAGQSVTIELNVAQQGTYDLKYAVKMSTLRGISQLAVNGINVGHPEDQYSAAEAFHEFDVGNLTIATSGNQSFTFSITGKNAASAGFSESFDYIKLMPQ
jgi:legume-like lectin family protein